MNLWRSILFNIDVEVKNGITDRFISKIFQLKISKKNHVNLSASLNKYGKI